MKLKVIVFGATGMVGEGVMHECLLHPEVESVQVANRRPCGVEHDKLTEILHADFQDFTAIENQLSGYDAAYFCMGVSSIGLKEEAYNKLTYDLTMHVAQTLKKLNPDMTFTYVSGSGTDSTEKGRSMWARIKGKTENDLLKLFDSAYMFRPGYIQPIKGLKNTYKVYRFLAPFYPIWNTLFPRYVCTLQNLGLAMIHVSRKSCDTTILENVDIKKVASREKDHLNISTE